MSTLEIIIAIFSSVLLPISGAALRELMRIRERLSELKQADDAFKDSMNGIWNEIKALRDDVETHGKQIYFLEKKYDKDYSAN